MELIELLTLIKAKRKEKGLSQKDVADYLGITQGAYSYLELGKTELSVSQFFKVCDLLTIDFTKPKKNNEVLIAITEDSIIENTTEISTLHKKIENLENSMNNQFKEILDLLKNNKQ